MDRPQFQLPLFLITALILLVSLPVYAQKQREQTPAEMYQDRQRALSLILYDSRIKSLEDAPMRCLARQSIVRYLAKSGPKDLRPYAVDFTEACLEESVRNEREFHPYLLGRILSQLINLVRRFDPERAAILEEKYPAKGFAKEMARTMELEESDDGTAVTTKVIDDIRAGSIPEETGVFISNLRRRNPELVDIVLEAVLTYYETQPGSAAVGRGLTSIAFAFASPKTPEPLRIRFLQIVLNLGRRAIADRSNAQFTKQATAVLLICLSGFEKYLPASKDEATAILQTLQASQSRSQSEEQEARERIKESDDKLAATIAEAEAAKDEGLSSRLWRSASTLAIGKDKLRIAADAVSKVKVSTMDGWKSFMLSEAIPRRALQKDKPEIVEYVLRLLENPSYKAQVMFLAASVLERKGSHAEAVSFFRRGLAFLSKADGTDDALRQYATAVSLALALKEGDVFEVARDAVDATNHLSSPGPEDTKGSEGRLKFLSVLSQSGAYVTEIFEKIAEKDPDMAYTVSQGIQRRDLRLLAEISVEKFKKYPLPESGINDQGSSVRDQVSSVRNR